LTVIGRARFLFDVSLLRSSLAACLAASVLIVGCAAEDGKKTPAMAGSAGSGGSVAGSSGGTGAAAGTGASGSSGGGGSPDAGSSADAKPDGLAPLPAQTCTVPASGTPATLLSKTGCVDPQDATKPAASLVPYDVNSPLWSDGAEKERFLAIPDGGKIHIKDCAKTPTACDVSKGGTYEDDGHLDVPIGSVFVKNFSLGGKRVETRLLMYVDQDFWKGFSYEWNDAQTDATLLPNQLDKAVGSQTWRFPAREDCLTCHTEAAGRSLGPTVAQLNRDYPYPEGKANILTRLHALGLLDAPLAKAPSALPALVTPAVTTGASVEQRARAYMHANCAICHRPGGSMAGMDLRADTALAAMAVCNVEPTRSDKTLGPLLKPGDHVHSIVSLRMHSLMDKFRMPQLATSVVDPVGTSVVDAWIDGLTGCP
jgi:uncharacterized repeat protein (TIGR03806 family)